MRQSAAQLQAASKVWRCSSAPHTRKRNSLRQGYAAALRSPAFRLLRPCGALARQLLQLHMLLLACAGMALCFQSALVVAARDPRTRRATATSDPRTRVPAYEPQAWRQPAPPPAAAAGPSGSASVPILDRRPPPVYRRRDADGRFGERPPPRRVRRTTDFGTGSAPVSKLPACCASALPLLCCRLESVRQ